MIASNKIWRRYFMWRSCGFKPVKALRLAMGEKP